MRPAEKPGPWRSAGRVLPIVALLVAALSTTGCRKQPPPRPTRFGSGPPSGHREVPMSRVPRPPHPGVEKALTPAGAAIAAGLAAPEESTPCDSAFGAMAVMVEAYRHAAGSEQALPWERVPSRPEFMAACAQLPPAEQPCLFPRYARGHEAACRPPLERIRSDPALEGVLVFTPRTRPPLAAPDGGAAAVRPRRPPASQPGTPAAGAGATAPR
jgi:hypothetical protein